MSESLNTDIDKHANHIIVIYGCGLNKNHVNGQAPIGQRAGWLVKLQVRRSGWDFYVWTEELLLLQLFLEEMGFKKFKFKMKYNEPI